MYGKIKVSRPAKKEETFDYCAEIRAITRRGFWMGGGGPEWSSDRNVFIPRKTILDSDTDLDEVQVGDDLTVEIPLWLARDRGLV